MTSFTSQSRLHIKYLDSSHALGLTIFDLLLAQLAKGTAIGCGGGGDLLAHASDDRYQP